MRTGIRRTKMNCLLFLLLLIQFLQQSVASIPGRLVLRVSPYTTKDISVWTAHSGFGWKNMTCVVTPIVTAADGKQYNVHITSYEWELNSTLTPFTSNTYPVNADSLAARGTYTCRVKYTYDVGQQTIREVSEFSRELVIVNTDREYYLALKPMFRDTSLEPAYGVVNASSDLRLTVGQVKTFDCSARAREGGYLEYKIWHNWVLMTTKSTFMITTVRLSDAGLWSCWVQNQYGEIMHHFNTTVEPATPGTGTPETSAQTRTVPVTTVSPAASRPPSPSPTSKSGSPGVSSARSDNVHDALYLVVYCVVGLCGICIGVSILMFSRSRINLQKKRKANQKTINNNIGKLSLAGDVEKDGSSHDERKVDRQDSTTTSVSGVSQLSDVATLARTVSVV